MKVEIDLPEIWVKQFKSLAGILQRADWKQELSWYLKWDGCNFLSDPEELAEWAMVLLADICPRGHHGETILPRVIARRALAYLARKKFTPLLYKTEQDLIDRYRVETGEITEKEAEAARLERLNPPPEKPSFEELKNLNLNNPAAAAFLQKARAWILASPDSDPIPGEAAEIIDIRESPPLVS